MTSRTMHVLIFALPVIALLHADNAPFAIANKLPLPETEEAQTALTEAILSNSDIRLSHNGTPNIPLEDMNLDVNDISLVHLTNLQLRSSPFHMTSVEPDLRRMSLNLHGNIDTLEVTGNYTISIEIMNHTSMAQVTSRTGSLNLTFQNLDISGLIGLNFNDDNLHVHTVSLLYRPNVVVLTVFYIDEQGNPQMTEERRKSVRGTVEDTIYTDLAKRMNLLIREEMNKILGNITISELMGNDTENEINFKASSNTRMGNINDFIDYILNLTKQNLTDEIAIPDFEKSFEKNMVFLRIRGCFKAKDGWLKNLKTLHRTSDVTMKQTNNTIQVQATMRMRTLEFGYGRYAAKLLRVGPSGRVTATVGRNSMSFRARLEYTDDCTVTLEEFRVRDLQDVKLRLTGLYPFNWIFSKIAVFFTNRSKFNIARAIEETVAKEIREKLEGFNCRQYFPEPAIREVHHVENNELTENEL